MHVPTEWIAAHGLRPERVLPPAAEGCHRAAGACQVAAQLPTGPLAAMNLIEELGGRLVGSEFIFPHAVDLLPTDVPPLTALARAALADPMVGSADERLTRIALDATAVGAEVVVLARIPGASHCPGESLALGQLPGLPVVEVEVPPLIDGVRPALTTRLQAAFEIARSRRC